MLNFLSMTITIIENSMTLNLNVLKSTHLDHYKENIAGFSVANTCSSCIHLTDKQKGNVNYSFRLN